MMTTFVSLYTIQIVLCIFLLSVTLTWLVRKFGIIDQPNPRSSHHKPIARSGGLAIVFSTYVGIVTLLWNYTIFPFSFVLEVPRGQDVHKTRRARCIFDSHFCFAEIPVVSFSALCLHQSRCWLGITTWQWYQF